MRVNRFPIFQYLIIISILLFLVACGTKTIRLNGGDYRGEIDDEQPSGYGEWDKDDGSESYHGFWAYGMMNGCGTLINGDYCYRGEFKDNKYDGYGELLYKDSLIYSGRWVKGERTRGVERDSIGRRIVGLWKADTLFSGRRIDSLGVYTGKLDKDGKADGHGYYIDNNGNYYEGHWENDQRNIFGFSISAKKGLRVGEWKKDNYKGERVVYTSDRIYGIDISKYQHEKIKIVTQRIRLRRRRRWRTVKKVQITRFSIDWNRLRITHLGTLSKKKVSGRADFPVSFVYIKSTEGVSIYNVYYASDCRQIRRHGMHAGAYHFFSILSDASAQAKFFLKYTSFHSGDFPPVLDVEPTNKQVEKIGGKHVLFNRIRTWMRIVEHHTGVKPILYVSQTFVNRYLSSAPDIKNKYMVWIARYGEYKPDVKLIYWQLCPDGTVRGIRGKVDINVFNGYSTQYDEFVRNACFK